MLEEIQGLSEPIQADRIREILQPRLADGSFAVIEGLANQLRQESYAAFIGGADAEYSRGYITGITEVLDSILQACAFPQEGKIVDPEPEFNPFILENLARAKGAFSGI